MTSKEIKIKIDRLRAIEPSDYVGSEASVAKVVWGFMGKRVSGVDLRNTLLHLLRQADIVLPKDADGEPINIGDKVVCDDGCTDAVVMTVTDFEVCAVCEGVILTDNGGDVVEVIKRSCCGRDLRHYRKPTVEDVLREFSDEVQRCCDTENTITEYASKLRKVMANDDAR